MQATHWRVIRGHLLTARRSVNGRMRCSPLACAYPEAIYLPHGVVSKDARNAVHWPFDSRLQSVGPLGLQREALNTP
jgi:hypothetical protein